MRKHYKAPWETKLKVLTGLFLTILILAGYVAATGFATVLIISIIAGCALFVVRGYSVMEGTLHIHRMGWSKTFDLDTLKDIQVSPNAMVGSIRTWGIGGLFGYIGYFKNSALGNYRAYATDSENTVVMEFNNETVVVSPDRPDDFAEAVIDDRKND